MQRSLTWSGIVIMLLGSIITAHVLQAAIFSTVNTDSKPETAPLRYVKNDAFGFGEILNYKVKYGFITAGYAQFKIEPTPVIIRDSKCYNVSFVVKSVESMRRLYYVRDEYRSYVDIDGIFPWQFEQQIREGKYSKDYKAELDHRASKAKVGDSTYPIEPFIHDAVSAFYYIRAQNLSGFAKNDTIPLKNFYDEKIHPLNVIIRGKQEIEVEAGTFRCIVAEPVIRSGGVFKADGRILIWFTDDERKIPVMVRTKVLIGSIDAELVSYSGLRGPVTSRVKG